MLRKAVVGLVVMSAALMTGCASNLKVKVLQPAPVNFGAAKRLSVVQTEGRRSARELLVNEIISQSRAAGQFTVSDRSEEGITMKIAGRTVDVTGAKTPQSEDEVFVRVDVIDWNASRDTKTKTSTDSKGNKTEKTETTYIGKVVLGITASNAANKALLAEKEYVATVEGEDEERSIEAAGRAAVWKFLADITPAYVDRYIRMDDDDDAQKPMIETAKAGNIPRAIEEMRGYVGSNPSNPAALYNLAVLLDANGQYEEALDLYSKAIAGSTKDYYVSMKSDCAKRLADRQALAQ